MTDDGAWMLELRHEVEALLGLDRPDRYEAGDTGWMDRAMDYAASRVPASTARAVYAETFVKGVESNQLRASNKLLREVFRSKEFPFDWIEQFRTPVSVGKDRVTLAAATPRDLDAFATEERRRAARDFTSRNETCEAAEWLAEQMQAQGADRLDRLDVSEWLEDEAP